MHCTQKITNDLIYIGASDRRLALFESAYPIPRGVSYNSYLLLDEKTVLFDTVDRSVADVFFENLAYALGGRKLDCLVITHMEPDHAGTLAELVRRCPEVKLIVNEKSLKMIARFFMFDASARAEVVSDGAELSFGRHTLKFVFAPMVHWPEVMVCYDTLDKTLFSADAFGTFGALCGNIFADETDFFTDWMDDARRYYTNIVGKYGPPVQALLKKASALDIARICPLHGPIWRENLGAYIDKYDKWSRCEPEIKGVLIAYASIYGHTENAANVLANALAERGVKNIAMFDAAVTHPSVIVAEAFRRSHLVFAAPTYNAGIFPAMETVLLDLAAHALHDRFAAVIENGTWAPTAGRAMREILEKMKNVKVFEPVITIPSAVGGEQLEALYALADSIAAGVQE